MSSLYVSKLYRYPVKSLPGLAVDRLELDDFGPAHDRRWMLVDSERHFVTQRTEPRLALINVKSDDGGQVVLTLPNGLSMELVAGNERCSVRVWKDQVEGLLAGGAASAQLSAWLGRELYFVFMPTDSVRPVNPAVVQGNRRVSFADGFPFLITNQASLASVTEWTGGTGDMRRFRPGIVISGAAAFAEDEWHWLRLGESILECVKPCSRCVITTVDPDTGVPDPDREPLRSLSRYRKTSAGVIFGQNALHWQGRSIAVGDPVELLDGFSL